jgi:hypothetical protein
MKDIISEILQRKEQQEKDRYFETLNREVNRCGIRAPLRVEANIFRHGVFLGRYITRDIDCCGAFVETSGLTMFENEIVDLAVAVPPEESAFVSTNAIVVRNAKKGVGLMFTNNSADSYVRMRRLIDELIHKHSMQIAEAP